MQMRDFCFWLQGFFEMNGSDKPLTAEQTKMVANHLNLVFKHMADAPVHHPDTMTDEQKQKAGEELLRRLREHPTEPFAPPFYYSPTVIC